MSQANLVRKFFRDLSEKAREIKSLNDQPTWKLADQTYLAVNPSLKCPSCKEWIPSERVWLFSEKSKKLFKVWDLRGNPIPLLYIHPHVNNGYVCVGNARDVQSALFTNIHWTDTYYSTAKFFYENFAHVCDGTPIETCYKCNESLVSYDLTPIGYGFGDFYAKKVCDSCLERITDKCVFCEKEFESGEIKETWSHWEPDIASCENCWYQRMNTCEICSQVKLINTICCEYEETEEYDEDD